MANLSAYPPELSEVIRATVDAVLMEANFCLPGKVVAYDSQTQFADVQIQLQSKQLDGTLVTIAPIPNVPVKWPRANDGSAFIHLPLKVGDDVTLIFSQRSLDNWKAQGGITDPGDPRKFHMSDAYAMPGGSALPDAFTPTTPDGVEIVNGQTHFIIYPNGKIQALNETGELISILDQITEQVELTNETLSTDTVNTWQGPQPLLAFETYANIADELGTLKTKLESFKV
jgi:hypothetical protein